MSDLPPPPSSPPPPPPPPPSMPPPPSSGGWQPSTGTSASFGQRFFAMFLDGLIIGLPSFIVWRIALGNVESELVLCRDGTAICQQPTGSGLVALIVVGLGLTLLSILYYGVFQGITGATFGRRAASSMVVKKGTLEPIGAVAGIGRYFATVISAIPCLLGYFWMLWDSDKETWHDKITGSRVIQN